MFCQQKNGPDYQLSGTFPKSAVGMVLPSAMSVAFEVVGKGQKRTGSRLEADS